MITLQLTDQQLAWVIEALQLRSNLVQTGSPYLSQADLQDQGKVAPTMTVDQMRLVVGHTDLVELLQAAQRR